MATAALPALPPKDGIASKINMGTNSKDHTVKGAGITSVTRKHATGFGATNKPSDDEVVIADDFTRQTFYLEAVQRDLGDSDDEINYDELPIEEFEDISDSDEEETLEKTVKILNEKSFYDVVLEKEKEEETVALTQRPEVVDDFIRNYLAEKGLFKSLEAFQNEWYEFQQKNKLSPEDVHVVPDVYQKNQELADALKKLRVDVENYKEVASKARSTYDKLRRERDFHRMHHKRVVQEKNRLIGDIKRLKKHYEGYEPTLKQLRHRYEVAMKEKMLTKLERDRLASKISAMESAAKAGVPIHLENSTSFEALGPAPANGKKEKEGAKATSKKSTKEVALPIEDRANVYSSVDLPIAKVEKLKQIHSIRAHTMAISCAKFHPKKMVLATVSDDKLWKMWTFPSCELIMSGEGHKEWIADCDFHPKGSHLATASGDATVKLWEFNKGIATLTLSEHTQAVWSCAFHDTGDFMASASMDHTAKLWDITTGKCRQTFRGHADSVNHVGFVPFTNTVHTCSGDKTLSLWDARTGLCSQTLYGHLHSINHVAFTLRGDVVASCDSSGVVKFWDIRNVSELESINLGPAAANKIAFDPSGTVLAAACNDGVKLFNIREKNRMRDVPTGEEPVQAVLFDRGADYLVTAGSDSIVRVFQ